MNAGFFIFIYSVLFAFLAWRRTEWAIGIILVSLPSYLIRFSIGAVPFTLLEVEILILSSCWVAKKITAARHPLPPGASILPLPKQYIIPILIFLISSTVATFVSPDLRAAAGIWKAYFFEPILFLIVFLNTITKEKIVPAMWMLTLSIVIPGIIAIYQKFTGSMIPNEFWAAEATRRVTSIYGYPNAIGLYFAPITAGIIAILVHKIQQYIKKTIPAAEEKTVWLKISLLSLVTVISLASIFFAKSRGALLGIAGALLFYALFWKDKRIIFATIIISVVLLISFISPITLSNPTTVSGGSSLEVRLDQWRETGEMLKDRPIYGAGLAGFQERVAPYHTKKHIEIYLYPHNIFLAFWSETGLAGLIAFLWIIFLFFKTSLRILHNEDNNISAQRLSAAEIPRLFLFMGQSRGTPNPDAASESQIPQKKISLSSRNQSHLPMAITGAMVALLAHGMIDVPYFKNDLAMLFWILIGLMIIQSKPAIKTQNNFVNQINP